MMLIQDIQEIDLKVEGRLDLIWGRGGGSGVILSCSLGVQCNCTDSPILLGF